MPTSAIDLYKLFGAVQKTMTKNQTALNKADDYNQNHGDHMVEIFSVITRAMKERSNASPADQLAYASQLLRQTSSSGSAQIYAENLQDASAKLGNVKQVTPDNAMTLIQTLLGAGSTITPQSQAPSNVGGSLIETLLGGGTTTSQGQSAGAGGDLLGSLLGGLTGGGSNTQSGKQGQIDMGQLLSAGMAFAQAKKAGRSNLDAILNAVVSSSKMNSTPARAQSGTLVANTLLQALSKMTSR